MQNNGKLYVNIDSCDTWTCKNKENYTYFALNVSGDIATKDVSHSGLN